MNYIRQIFRNSAKVWMPLALAIAGVLQVIPAQALTFKFNADPSTDSRALAQLEAAGDLWSSLLSDNVTININVGFGSLSPSVLGETSNLSEEFSYLAVENALIGDRASADDAIATANLPGIDVGNSRKVIAFIGTDEQGDPAQGYAELDGSTLSRDNEFLNVSRANAKALGLIADDGSLDATINFNGNFKFDFDRADGIASDSFDFLGIATHEIGHALGFVSGVDDVDYFAPANGPGAFTEDLDQLPVFSILDLFRYSTDSLNASNLLGLPVLDLAADSFPKYFSIDGGVTNLGDFSTGVYNGDGEQASHWKNNFGLGIMAPTTNYSQLLTISSLDLRAFDVIGWNLRTQSVPEPTTILGSLALGAGFLLKRKAIKRNKTNS